MGLANGDTPKTSGGNKSINHLTGAVQQQVTIFQKNPDMDNNKHYFTKVKIFQHILSHTPTVHSPPGIMSDRALVDTDFGTLLTANCFSVISGLGAVRKVAVSEEGLQELSRLSTPSPRDGA